jgi:hypothetical protein
VGSRPRRPDRDRHLGALDTQVAGGLFYLPNNEADALLHFATSTIWLAGAAHYFLIERE